MSETEGGFSKVSKGHIGVGAHPDPMFTVYPSGSGRFNKAAVTEYLDGDVEHVTFYANPDAGELGISLGGGADAYKLTHNSSGGAEASIRTALRNFGVAVDDLDESHTMEIEDRRSEGLLVVDLTPVPEDGGQR